MEKFTTISIDFFLHIFPPMTSLTIPPPLKKKFFSFSFDLIEKTKILFFFVSLFYSFVFPFYRWITTYIAQLNPLFGPQVKSTTLTLMQKWGF